MEFHSTLRAFFLITSASLPLVVVLWLWRRKNQKKNKLYVVGSDGTVEGTLEDLAKAEQQLALYSAADLKREFFATYTRIDELHTNHGYSLAYVEQLVSEAKKRDIDLLYSFSDTLVPGIMSYTERTGVYTIYAPRESLEEARAVYEEMRRLGSTGRKN